MIKAQVRVQPDADESRHQIFQEHRINEREQGVDGIARRAAVALREIEARPCLFVRRRSVRLYAGLGGRSLIFERFSVALAHAVCFEHQREFCEVISRRCAFDAQKLFERHGALGIAARIG